MKKFVLIAFFSVPVFASAAVFSVKPVTLTIPDGFEGPVRGEGQGGVVVGFTKNNLGPMKTLLQITIYNASSKSMSKSEINGGAAASKCLLEFVGGVARRRMDFNRTEPVMLKISGLPAAKLSWTGRVQEIETVGVMYCFISGTDVISFHTQGIGTIPTPAMIEAANAFESAKVNAGE